MNTPRLHAFPRAALMAALLAVTAATSPFAQSTYTRIQLLDQVEQEIEKVIRAGRDAPMAEFAAWKTVDQAMRTQKNTASQYRSDSKSTVADAERLLALAKANTDAANQTVAAAKLVSAADKAFSNYAKLEWPQPANPATARPTDLVVRCSALAGVIAKAKAAPLLELKNYADFIPGDTKDCAPLGDEVIALQGKAREFDNLKAIVPRIAQQNPVLAAVAAFADLTSKHAALTQRAEQIRKTGTTRTALDDSIKQLLGMNLEAEGYAKNAQGGGNVRTVRVLNTLEREANVFWRAAGCAGVFFDQTAVCNNQPVKPGQTVEYQFKLGTSLRKVGFRGVGCATQETSIAMEGAGTDLHVITDGCQIKPESAALSESVQKRTKYFRNNRDKPVEVLFASIQTPTMCFGTYKGSGFVCRTLTVAPRTEVRYEYPLGTIMSGVGVRWIDETCSTSSAYVDFPNSGKALANPGACTVSSE
jgi:hypothetical protein